ncbi:MAG: hypothetical protein A3E37_00655 [Candidatus Andersenbacteria bacterium RIFCSPHIGHO2_12_FULL_46_9]|nr:MAG: Glycosyl transferase group 1 [Parcubacteria group bacterium GW2011_GWA2_45_14]OGY33789.1 MAG: hypothetical protein A3B76_02920 [Candidatus Andersenbacteria bacterium RIFCSPHIGHO2_02_FULL_46_16]OGY35372.1 MAG: hypothetical protein A3E37_00655 [Candidatus Andersenbacteria bacterium RIFCSPHIGHO2_12_FULL_46_9]OGY36224.1 MAG: hypothetical protein A3I08_05240 [Candidatus Andersenbacteria bacterium RIFCSPLOWO2_02_FULL_46_11]OGY40080.1 MAG: hypothetical protein A3G57_02810 [Candidatus Andersenb
MIIFLPANIRPTGGSSNFALKLQRGLRPKKHLVVFKFTPRFDLLLVNATCPIRYLLFAKLTRRPIVHRLDGVYYPMSVARWKYIFYNLPMQIILHFFANAVIYQSQYSKDCCDKFLGTNHYIPNHLVYNGVDTQLFSHHGSTRQLRDVPEQPIFITASRFRRSDQILPLIDAFRLYQKNYQARAKLIIVGDFSHAVTNFPQQYTNDSLISFLGPIPNGQLPEYYRGADVFLFTHLNPPCPNNIIEAMACGLPICGIADGAMAEITTPDLNSALIPAPGSGFNQSRRLDLHAFAANLNKIMLHRKEYASHSRRIASQQFTLQQMIRRYLSAITPLVEHSSSYQINFS